MFSLGQEKILNDALIDDDGKPIKKAQATLYLAKDEVSLRDRRDRDKGAYLHQLEFVRIVTADPLATLPEKPRLHFSGSNRGDLVGPVALPKTESMFHVTWGEKKDMLGKDARIKCGGGLQLPPEERQHQTGPR